MPIYRRAIAGNSAILILLFCLGVPCLGWGASLLAASPDRNGRLQASTGISGTAGRLTSSNGKFWLTMQTDGNLVLYRGDCASSPNAGCAVWTARTSREVGDYYLAVQNDGNLVLYRGKVSPGAPSSAESSANAYWDTHTHRAGKGFYFLSVEDDGNLVLWEGRAPSERRTVIWSIRTAEGGVASPAASTSPSASAPLNLNGSWQNNLLHIWQEGEQVLITASWRRADLGVWVIWRAEGRLTGSGMSLPLRYSSMVTAMQGNLRGEFQISSDGNTIHARYTLDGREIDRQVYSRDH